MTHHYTYILCGPAAKKGFGGPVFIGTTRNLKTRLTQHRFGRASVDAFRIDQLVYVERHASLAAATTRAEKLQTASREWIDALVERKNPDWRDLATLAKVETQHAA